VADNQTRPGGPSGRLAVALALGGWVLGWCLWPGPQGFLQPEVTLSAQMLWAVGMAVIFGVAVASVRRGPGRWQTAGCLAMIICFAGIWMVADRLIEAAL
jgi:hypothetical protein